MLLWFVMVRIHTAESLGAIAKAHYAPHRGKHQPRDLIDVSKDRGCAGISRSCLACPLSICLEDLPKQEQQEVKRRFLQEKKR